MTKQIPAPNFSRLAPAPGQSLLIIGGCGGIGRVLALAAIENDLDVSIMDLPQSINSVDLPAEITCIDIDLREEQSTISAFESLAERGKKIEHVVFASGYTSDLVAVKDIQADGLDDIMNGNLRGQVFAAREALSRMTEGSFVFVSTAIGQVGAPGYAAYAMAKAGLNALTRILAAEGAPQIRANGVAPGPVDTAFIRGGMGRGVTGQENDSVGGEAMRFDRQAFEERIPLARIGLAEDIAGPILFLMSDAARYISGQVLHVNGGGFMRD